VAPGGSGTKREVRGEKWLVIGEKSDGSSGGVDVLFREAVTGVRLRVRIDSGVKVLIGQKHWSVRS
jgi:hypothetical protein